MNICIASWQKPQMRYVGTDDCVVTYLYLAIYITNCQDS